MKFKENVQKILQKLGFAGSEESLKALTPDEWKQFFASYHEEFGTDFHADMQAYQDEQHAVPDQAQINEAFSVLSGLINPKQNVEDAAAHGVQDTKTEQPTAQQVLDMAKAVSATFMAMGNHAADDVPMTTVAGSVVGFTGSGDREKFLFGIEHEFFSMDKPWNRFTANPTSDQRLGDKKIAASFGAEVEAYSSSLAERYSYLQSHNQLNPEKLAAGEFATDYSQVTGMKGGDQYLIRRQDAIIARMLSIRQLTQYFPVRYGIQDRDVIFNAFFGEVSQAYQVGEVYKGDMEIEPEMGYVDDAMIKMKFGPMKELERMYIGYLNREGSDPIKWSMIEYAIMGSLENAQREQNMRRMRGLYVKPETGVAGSYLNAGTGVLYTLIRLHHEHKLLLTDNVAYRTYDDANMLETVQEFYKEILAKVSEDMSLDQHVMYLNENHKQWWIQNVREAMDNSRTLQDRTVTLISYRTVLPICVLFGCLI